MIEDDDLLNKYNTIWDTFILKTKIKSYGEEATDFHDKEIPVCSNHNYLAVINLDSALQKKIKTIIPKYAFKRT